MKNTAKISELTRKSNMSLSHSKKKSKSPSPGISPTPKEFSIKRLGEK